MMSELDDFITEIESASSAISMREPIISALEYINDEIINYNIDPYPEDGSTKLVESTGVVQLIYNTLFDGDDLLFPVSSGILEDDRIVPIINDTIIEYIDTHSISTIRKYAFYKNLKLLTVSFPECAYIGEAAFYGNWGLRNLSFPKCSYIDCSAFQNCSNLASAFFSKCSYINYDAFYGCRLLFKVSFPECSYIGKAAFAGCTTLKEASFPECLIIGASSISSSDLHNSTGAFGGCNYLTVANFPKCSYIEYSTFYNCNRLSEISFPECTYVGTYAFKNCSILSEVFLPLCSYIGFSTFEQCSNLSIISLNKCTFIGHMAFHSCPNLKSVYLLASSICSLFYNEWISEHSFDLSQLSANNAYIYVPHSLYYSYITDSIWSVYSERISGYYDSSVLPAYLNEDNYVVMKSDYFNYSNSYIVMNSNVASISNENLVVSYYEPSEAMIL